jgi:integrase
MATHRVIQLKPDVTTNRAFVRYRGNKIYFGTWGTREANAKFADWYAKHVERPATTRTKRLRVIDCVQRYLRYCETYYVEPDGDLGTRTNGEFRNIVASMNVLLQFAGGPKDYAVDFGPKKVKQLQKELSIETILDGARKGKTRYCRKTINAIVNRIRRCFRWCVSEQLIPAEIVTALEMVPGMKKGRTEAREKDRITSVDVMAVRNTLSFLSPTVGDMVRVQFLCGMRPQDVCGMTEGSLDRSGEIWLYRPPVHKNSHRDQELIKAVPPAAQLILRRWMTGDPDRAIFSPFDSVVFWRSKMRKKDGDSPPLSRRRGFYTSGSYGKAIKNAIIRANKSGAAVPHWAPNQLRHSIGTQLRTTSGVEAAQVFLGHAKPDATLIYAEVTTKKLSELAKLVSPLEDASGTPEQS